MTGVTDLTQALAINRTTAEWSLGRDGRLRVFKANEARRTDLGLLIEAAGINRLADESAIVTGVAAERAASVDAPSPNTRVLRLAPRATAAWTLLPRAHDGEGAAQHGYATFSIWVRLDTGAGGKLEVRAGDVFALVDLATGTAEPSSEDCWTGIASSGEWRRVWLTWRTGHDVRMTVTVRGAPSPPSDVLLAEPVYEDCGSATTFTQARRGHEEILCAGPLAAALRADEFTLAIETRNLTTAPVSLPLLWAGADSWLSRTANGGLGSAIGPGAATAPIPLDAWARKQRSVLSVSRRHDTIVVALRGARPVKFRGSVPRSDVPLRLGGGAGAALNGFVSRISVLDTALGLEAAREFAE